MDSKIKYSLSNVINLEVANINLSQKGPQFRHVSFFKLVKNGNFAYQYQRVNSAFSKHIGTETKAFSTK